MQTSNYLKTFFCDKKQDHVIVLSTRTAAKTLLKRNVFQKCQSGSLSSANTRRLSRLGLVVPDRETERRDAAGLFHRFNEKSTTLTVTVVLNLDCNFSCRYCYEGRMKGRRYMSDETADHLVAFIKDQAAPTHKSLVINFYGGEPMLSVGLVERLSERLKAFTHTQGTSFHATMVTNGSLLKPALAERLTALGLTSVKITLDGPAHVHNRLRPFKSGAGSFDVVVKNIKDCCDLVNINTGGNYDQATYPEMVALLDYFNAEGLTPEKLGEVKFNPIVSPGSNLPEYQSGCLSINEPWILTAEALLREEVLKRGYETPRVISPMVCAIEQRDFYVVNYNGDIYKCPGFLGNKAFSVGTISTGVTDYSDTHKLDIWKNQECLDCAYLPLCFGGCRYMTYLRNGGIDAVDCKKAYFDAQLETLVKQDIAYQKTASPEADTPQ